MISIRIVSADYYMSPPVKELDAIYSQFRGAEIKQVPIIRIFGTTSQGKKTCLHIHGVFPYLYVPYDTSSCDADKFIYQVTTSIEKALNISLRNTNSNTHHVYKISEVKGIPFYGYHRKEHKFLKIYLYNPAFLKKTADLLQNGAVLGQVYQPHESHLSFILQFFIDYNLHGMSFIDIASVKYRQCDNYPLDIPADQILPKSIMRMSRSELEIDCMAMHILNRNEIVFGNLAINPGLAAIWQNERARKQDRNIDLNAASTQPRANVQNTKSELFFKERLKKSLANKTIDTMSESRILDSMSSGETSNLNDSVYPEENDDVTLSNASLIESHCSGQNADISGAGSKINLDDEDNKLLNLLRDLEENAGIEDDSILGTQTTQLNVSKENDVEADISTEDENDLSIALVMDDEQKNEEKNADDVEASNNIWETSFWDTINNSQMDNEKINSPTEIRLSNKSLLKGSKSNEKTFQESQTVIATKLDYTSKIENSSIASLCTNTHVQTGFFKNDNVENITNNSFDYLINDNVTEKSLSNDSQYKVDNNITNISGADQNNKYYNSAYHNRNEANYTKLNNYESQILRGKISNNKIALTPINEPLSRSEVIASLKDYNIPECKSIQPFYGNPKDVSSKKEIGFMTLKIPSRTVNELEEFHTSSDLELYQWRSNIFKELNVTSGAVNMKTINVFLSSEAKCAITPILEPPTVRDVANWLKAKELLKIKDEEKIDKPVIKPLLLKFSIPNSPSDGDMNCSFNDSINMSPCTPLSEHKLSLTPDSTRNQNTTVTTMKRKAFRNLKKPKKTLFPSLLDDIDSDKSCDQVDSSQSTEIETPDHSQDVSSNDTVKQLLEQSDYVRGLLSPAGNASSNNSEDTIVPTLDNTHDIHLGEKNFKEAKPICEHQYITLLCLEVHTQTRQDLKPDPAVDPIRAAFYAITNDVPENHHQSSSEHGLIVVDFLHGAMNENFQPNLDGVFSSNVVHTKNEYELIDEVIKLILKWDPDIMAGYEIEMLSWGYLLQRASVLGINLTQQIHRAMSMKNNDKQWGEENTEVITVIGRIMLDIWRLLRHEVALMNYTFENVMYNILQQRIPLHSFRSLTFWWEHPTPFYRWIVVEYYLLRVKGIIKLLDQLDLIGRTSELARLFGIQFYEVLSRGSQFRVESMMLRLAKPLNYVAVSPSVQQRAHMRAPEFLPLILEPESRFYTDPVIVLDFQSLYPSMIIAYNYCFSTCLGRVEHLGKSTAFEFGASQLRVSKTMLTYLLDNDLITISPCGVAFVVKDVRFGILPRMLQEILDTRLMVKKSMKENSENRILQRLLHSQQLGLKLIANVTYGYTAANFSGRMPCIEVGDSVVAKGRETLERAIKLVENTEKWGAKVVYGDTDSLFVLVPGRSRERAFEIGAEIAESVTQENPHPVKLKLEKVYQPCILQTKKRYVGYMYESPSQKEPTYDAKGIETVRRDGCPAVAKILEKSIRILFETCDVSKIKSYVCKKFSKILSGEMSIQDLIFAKEFRGLHSYKPGACVPGLVLARSWITTDKRSEPRRGERVPYVIVNGLPNTPLIQLVRSPRELLTDPGLRINAIYYITRVIIPPLNRCLSLIGVDVHNWFAEIPRKTQQFLPTIQTACSSVKKSTVSQYFSTEKCAACGVENRQGICDKCRECSQKTVFVLHEKLRQWERTYDQIEQVCKSCCNRHDIVECISLDCPTFFRFRKSQRDCQQAPYIRSLLDKYF